MFLLRNGLLIIGVLLIVLVQNLPAHTDSVDYSLAVVGNSTYNYSLYTIDIATLEHHLITDQLTPPSYPQPVFVSPNGYTLAFLAYDQSHQNQLFTTMNHSPHRYLATIDPISPPVWSGDSRYILYQEVSKADLVRISPTNSVKQSLIPIKTFDQTTTPNGQWIFYVTREANMPFTLYRIDQYGKNKLKLLDNEMSGIFKVSDHWVYYFGDEIGDLKRLSVDGKHQETIFTVDQNYSGTISVDGDIKGIDVVLNQDLTIYGIDERTKFQLNLKTDFEATVYKRFSPDGKWVYFNNPTGLCRVRLDGSQFELVAPLQAGRMLWHPNGKRLFFWADEQIYRVNLDSLDLKQLTNNAGGKYLEGISPDGKWIIFMDNASQGYFYRMDTNGNQIERLMDAQLYPNSHWLQTPTYSYHANQLLLSGLGLIALGGLLHVRQRVFGKLNLCYL